MHAIRQVLARHWNRAKRSKLAPRSLCPQHCHAIPCHGLERALSLVSKHFVTHLGKVDPTMTTWIEENEIDQSPWIRTARARQKVDVDVRTWYFLFCVQILEITVSEPVDRPVFKNTNRFSDDIYYNGIHTGQSLWMCQLWRHQYIAFGATIPSNRLHECREYTARATAWVWIVEDNVWFCLAPSGFWQSDDTGPGPER